MGELLTRLRRVAQAECEAGQNPPAARLAHGVLAVLSQWGEEIAPGGDRHAAALALVRELAGWLETAEAKKELGVPESPKEVFRTI